jgi:hypothetical protein
MILEKCNFDFCQPIRLTTHSTQSLPYNLGTVWHGSCRKTPSLMHAWDGSAPDVPFFSLLYLVRHCRMRHGLPKRSTPKTRVWTVIWFCTQSYCECNELCAVNLLSHFFNIRQALVKQQHEICIPQVFKPTWHLAPSSHRNGKKAELRISFEVH